ncbi:DNA translocase FtsK [Lacticaseibacillus porcinae]|uniref:DNA translocase FtsK n=1 Tax=Lacticaseibacillus porcinae TaxID=1123687 RepID=UPI000F7911A8|nr:DNA translocase FtsK [Lacticaseibacillus porcinae]
MATRRKPTTRKRKPARRTATKDHTLNWVGVVFVVIGLLAMFRLGLIGAVFANCFRLIGGNTFLFLTVLFTGFGAWLTATATLPHIRPRWLWGGLLAYISILVLVTGLSMTQLNVHSHFELAIWRTLQNDFALVTTTSDAGGGLVGGLLFGLFAPLISMIGTEILFGILTVVGILIIAGVKAEQVFHVFHVIGQGFAKIINSLKTGIANMQDQAKQRPKRQPKPKKAKPTVDKDLPKPRAEADDFTINAPTPAPQSVAPQPKPESQPEPKPADDEGELDTASAGADYIMPPISLLSPVQTVDQSKEVNLIKQNRIKLKDTMDSFGVDVSVKSATLGPSITQYEIQPATGVKVSKIVNLADDLALALAAKDIRIEAPIPGKSLIGIEVPNTQIATVGYRDVLEQTPMHPGKPLVIPLGKDVNGHVQTMDLSKMPHLLIAGATGSGKSVMINVIITSILMTAKPDQVRMMLIDPKKVELSVYNGVPHLLTPVVTEAKLAPSALNKVLKEMEHRYERFAAAGVRNMGEYNKKVEQSDDATLTKMPYIVVIVDELSDLMMVAGNEVETAIVRLAQMARAAGIHIIIATQRPSVDVITGLIKANIPSRIAFAVSSGVDSRTILDANGAEKLLGRGDMLYKPIDASSPMRIQGAFIPSDDVEAVVSAITDQVQPEYIDDMAPSEAPESGEQGASEDELYEDAKAFVIQQQSASTSLLQRRFRIGYNRAARLIDDLQQQGIITPPDGAKPRKVLVDPPEEQE